MRNAWFRKLIIELFGNKQVVYDISIFGKAGNFTRSINGTPSVFQPNWCTRLADTILTISPQHPHFQFPGISNGTSSGLVSGNGFSFLILPSVIIRCFSSWICWIELLDGAVCGKLLGEPPWMPAVMSFAFSLLASAAYCACAASMVSSSRKISSARAIMRFLC